MKALLIIMNLNGGQWLAGAIAAAQAAKICTEATIPGCTFDVWIIDVGSSDDSHDIMARCQDKGAQFSVQHDELLPQSVVTNRLLRRLEPEGHEFFFYLANDDILLPWAPAVHLKEMQADSELMLTHGRCIFWMEKQQGLYLPDMRDWHTKMTVNKVNGITQPSTCTRMEAFKKWGLLDESIVYAWDYELWARILAKGGKIKWLDTEPMSYYRFRQDNGTHKHIAEMTDEAHRIAQRWQP